MAATEWDVLGATSALRGNRGQPLRAGLHPGDCNLIAANGTVGSTIILGNVYVGGTATETVVIGDYIGLDYVRHSRTVMASRTEVGISSMTLATLHTSAAPGVRLHRNVIFGMRTSEIDVARTWNGP